MTVPLYVKRTTAQKLILFVTHIIIIRDVRCLLNTGVILNYFIVSNLAETHPIYLFKQHRRRVQRRQCMRSRGALFERALYSRVRGRRVWSRRGVSRGEPCSRVPLHTTTARRPQSCLYPRFETVLLHCRNRYKCEKKQSNI